MGFWRSLRGEWGPSAPAFLLVYLLASKRAGPRGSGVQGPALRVALGLSPVCRLVSPLYLPPCLHHRCDFVERPHSPEAMGSGPPPGPCQTGRGQAWEGVRLFSPLTPIPHPARDLLVSGRLSQTSV